MLRRKEAFTVVTPIPFFIPRQLAIDILHSHSEVITLNPLVLGHKAITAPRDAAADEFYSTWYEIEERIQVLPGVGKIGSGKIRFKGCFHDMPWGLQTHIYAPMSIDLRNKYRIAGNQPGIESPEHREIGLEALGAPSDGLYLREDIEIKCNFTMVSFVKKQLKAASKEMVQRIIKKAELLDAGVLKAMMEDGRLKTVNPNDRSATPAADVKRNSDSQAAAAGQMRAYNVQMSPQLANATHLPPSYSPSYPQYVHPVSSPSPQLFSHQHPYQQGLYPPPPLPPPPPPPPPKEHAFAMELPGDYSYPQSSPQPSSLGYRGSVSSSNPPWSQPQPSPAPAGGQQGTSMNSGGTGGSAHPGFATELSSHNESKEEYFAHAR